MTDKIYFECPVPQSEDEASLQKTKEYLETQAKSVCSLIDEMQNKLLLVPAKPCSEVTSTYLEQAKHNTTSYLLETENEVDLPNTDAEAYVELYKTLVEENRKQSETLKLISSELNQELAELEEIKQSLKCMQADERDSDEEEMDPELLNLVQINNEITRKFKSIRTDFHNVLGTLFTDGMKTLIEKLTMAYYKGGDEKYIEIDETVDDLAFVQLLKNASLIVFDPYNQRRIKFDEIA